MTDSERLKSVIDFYLMNVEAFGRFLGLKQSQSLRDILKGRNGISKPLAEKIKAKCLDINPSWLLSGEGEMLKNPSNNSVVREDSAEYIGDSFNNRLLELINKGDYYPAYIVKEKNKRIEELIEEVGRLKYEIAELKKGRAKMEGDAS